MKTLCIEIGEHFTRVANIHHGGGKFALGDNFVIKTPQNAYDDGYLRDTTELVDKLFSSFHKYGINNRKAAFVITSSKIINREIVLPQVPSSKINQLVMSNIGEYFPVDLSVYQISSKVMSKFTEDNQKKMRLMVIAVPKDLLENYYELAKTLGITLMNIDYAGNSIYQLVKHVEKEGTMFSIHIGDNSSVASIVSNGVLEFQRTIPFGIDSILNNVADYFPEAKSNRMIILEKLKANQWVNGMIDIDDDDDESGLSEDEIKKKRITESFKPFLDRIERLVHYYLSMKSDARLDRMILTGTGSAVEGLPNLLQFELGMVVGGISSVKNLKMEKQKQKGAAQEHVGTEAELEAELSRELTSMSLCVGGLIDPMDLISMFNNGKKNVNVSITPGIIAAVASGLLCAGMIVFTQLQLKEAEAERDRLNARIEELSAVEAVYTKYENVSAVLNDIKDMVSMSRTPNENLVAFIEELEEKLPSSAQVSSLSITSSGVSMNILTGSWIDAADAITQLKSFKSVSSVATSGVAESTEISDKVRYVYYVDGEKVDSLSDALAENPDANITIEEIPEGEEIKTYGFSVQLTWKDLATLEEEEAQEALESNTDEEIAETEEGGEQ